MKKIGFLSLFYLSLHSILLFHSYSLSDEIQYSEKRLAVVITTYNTARWCEKNLKSVITQNYENYYVIIVDDGSSDGTPDVIQELITEWNVENKVQLVKIPERQRKLKNIYSIYHSIPDWDIIVVIDGDDWLEHNNVFNTINQAYQNENVWLTYGQVRTSKGKGCATAVPENIVLSNQFRSWKWVYSHPKTFYAWVFKLIKLQDLLTEKISPFTGKFYPAAIDVAFMLPMLEMSGMKHKFIPEILYCFNSYHPLSTHIVSRGLGTKSSNEIRKMQKYQPLPEPRDFRLNKYQTSKADVIAFISDTSNKTEIIKILSSKMQNIGTIFLATDSEINDSDSNVISVPSSPEGLHLLKNHIQTSPQKHILLYNNSISIQKGIDLRECILWLEKTYAYGFYLNLDSHNYPFNEGKSKKIISHQYLDDSVFSWKFMCGNSMWNSYNNIDMTLYRTKHIVEVLNTCTTLAEFPLQWKQSKIDAKKVGLFFKTKVGAPSDQ